MLSRSIRPLSVIIAAIALPAQTAIAQEKAGVSPSAPLTRTIREIIAGSGPVRPAPVPGDMPARALTPQGLVNLTALARAYGYAAHFSATDEAAAADWPVIAIAAVEQVEPAHDAAALARALNTALRPHAPDFCAYVEGAAAACGDPRPADAAGAVAWRHNGRQIATDGFFKSDRVKLEAPGPDQVLTVDLGGGVKARVPLAAWIGTDGKTLARSPAPPVSLARPAGWIPAGFDRSTRLADTIAAWNLFQHFYPYFDVVKTDWPAVLARTLTAAASDADDKAFETTLRRMVAALEDAHGRVAYSPPPNGRLPILLDWIDGRLVVTATTAGAEELLPGDTIETISGTPAAELIAARMKLFSGSAHWRRLRAIEELQFGPAQQRLALHWSRPGAGGVTTLAFNRAPTEPRPEQLSELRPGILYVDISRASPEFWQGATTKLAAAKGIVFDLRGYPKGPPSFLSHFSSTPFKSMPMHVPVATRPNREGWSWSTTEWDMRPVAPLFPGKRIFLTDERAISYSESLLMTVKGNKLGVIVGEPTAGANGNINPTPLPGGYVLFWTGMRVLNIDGSVHHTKGVTPDVIVRRTAAGVRAGRDEVLEKGIELAGG
jgi:hypothetical protein